jgi:hypothetical protein
MDLGDISYFDDRIRFFAVPPEYMVGVEENAFFCFYVTQDAHTLYQNAK